MSIATGLGRFLEASGVDANTARAVSTRIAEAARRNQPLGTEELILAHEYLQRSSEARDAEFQKLQRLVEQGSSGSQGAGPLASRAGAGVADKQSRPTMQFKLRDLGGFNRAAAGRSGINHNFGKIQGEGGPYYSPSAGRAAHKIGDRSSGGAGADGTLRPGDIRQLAHQIARR